MDRFALLVDAGYFFAAGAEVRFGSNVQRHDMRLADSARVIDDLRVRAEQACPGMQLLRVYWYDATRGAVPSLEQNELALQPGVKLRLGVLNSVGQQKGVDSLIVTDLVELARNRAVADIILMSGDEDMRIGVQIAQSYGLRVHLWGVGDPLKHVSRQLRMEVDTFVRLADEWVCGALEPIVSPAVAGELRVQTRPFPEPARDDADELTGRRPGLRVVVEAVEGESLEAAADRVAREILSGVDARTIGQLDVNFRESQQVPSDYDRILIAATARARGGVRLTSQEMRVIRGVFVTVVRGLVAPEPADT